MNWSRANSLCTLEGMCAYALRVRLSMSLANTLSDSPCFLQRLPSSLRRSSGSTHCPNRLCKAPTKAL